MSVTRVTEFDGRGNVTVTITGNSRAEVEQAADDFVMEWSGFDASGHGSRDMGDGTFITICSRTTEYHMWDRE